MTSTKRKLKTLQGTLLDNERVLVRVDFNITIGPDNVVDQYEDYRIKAAMPTIQDLRQKRCKVILLTHLGHPKALTTATAKTLPWDLEPIRKRCEELLGYAVLAGDAFSGESVEKAIERMHVGEVMLLPNVRFDQREKTGSHAFAHELSSLASVYVNEAFSVSHRNHTSVAVVPMLLPAYAGYRTAKEVAVLTEVRDAPRHPYVAIMSGAKIKTKVTLIHDLLGKVDRLCVAGKIANIFLAAQGKYRSDTFDLEEIAIAKKILDTASGKISIPQDVVVGEPDGTGAQVLDIQALEKNTQKIWDIGPKSVQHIVDVCRDAKMIMWNGPVGMVEVEAYRTQTETLAQELARLTAYRVVGGGDTVNALARCGLMEQFDHVSVGGGAMTAFLEGKIMPGLEPLYV